MRQPHDSLIPPQRPAWMFPARKTSLPRSQKSMFAKRLLASLALAVTSLATAAPSRPNIVFFLLEEVGIRDLGSYGSTFYETPNVYRLAKQGALFTDAYAACPVCSPTRAAVQTGRWPQRTGVTDYIGAAMKPELWKRNTKLLPAPYSDRLAQDEVTMGEMLKSAGYATFFAGKWHLGPEGWWPENQGYDHNLGGVDRGGPYGRGKYFVPYDNPRLPDGPEGEHLPDRLATEANRFIEANKNQPFFAFFSFYSVHTPLQSRPDLEKKYEAKRQKLGLEAKWGKEDTREVRQVQEHPVYAGMVEAMDLAVGKVLAKLDELGLAENTLVIFTSDNGGLSTSEGSPTSNLPLRGGKGWMYEGGIREPLIVRWPATVKPGLVLDTPVSSPDFFATAMEVAEAKTTAKIDGVSLLPVLKGGSLPERALYWHYPHYGNQGGAPGSAIREGDWKLIEWFEDGKRELFNLREDIGEKNDLSQTNPEKVTALAAKLEAWRKEVGALMPIKNETYDATKPNGRLPGGGLPPKKKKNK